MRIYETTFVLNSQTDDATLETRVKEVLGIITGAKGKVLHEDRVGTRRLAYAIAGLQHGYYTTITFEGTNEILSSLDRHYHLQEAYLRYLTVQYEGDPEKIGQPLDIFQGQSEHEGEGEGGRGRGRRYRSDYGRGGDDDAPRRRSYGHDSGEGRGNAPRPEPPSGGGTDR